MSKNVSAVDVQDIKNDAIDVPNEQGVYAWYRKIYVDDTSQKDFEASIRKVLKKEWISDVEWQIDVSAYEVTVNLKEKANSITESKKSIALDIGDKTGSRTKFSYLTAYASVMQEPLYIGKANDLEDRIEDHIKGKTGFYKRISDAGFSPSDCVVLYIELKDLPSGANKLLEYIVDSLSRPYYGKKSG